MYSTTRPLMLLMAHKERHNFVCDSCRARLASLQADAAAEAQSPAPGRRPKSAGVQRSHPSPLAIGSLGRTFYEHSRARGVVVSHPLSMWEALGSIPSVSSCSSAVLLDLGGSFCLWRPVVISPTRCCCWLGAAWLAGAGSCSCKAVAAVAVAACMQHQQLNKPRPTAADMCSDS